MTHVHCLEDMFLAMFDTQWTIGPAVFLVMCHKPAGVKLLNRKQPAVTGVTWNMLCLLIFAWFGWFFMYVILAKEV